jgi:hypothetical protein
MAVGTLLGIAAGARALGGIAAGGQTIAQSRQMFTRQDRERLEELEAAREAGELGMSEAQREGMRGEIAAERGALLRSQESRALREAAAQPTVTGRDIFLREQLAQEQAAEFAAAGEGLVTEADIAAKAAQQRLQALRRAGQQGVQALAQACCRCLVVQLVQLQRLQGRRLRWSSRQRCRLRSLRRNYQTQTSSGCCVKVRRQALLTHTLGGWDNGNPW